MRCSWRAPVVLAVAGSLLLAGCYHYEVVSPDASPATVYEHRTVSAYFWGLLQDPPVVASDCKSKALYDVRVSTNIGYILLSVLTLGIWVPMDVDYRCAKMKRPDGILR